MLIAVLLVVLTFGLTVSGYAQDQETKPPLNPLRITGEVLAGGVGGLALGSLLFDLAQVHQKSSETG